MSPVPGVFPVMSSTAVIASAINGAKASSGMPASSSSDNWPHVFCNECSSLSPATLGDCGSVMESDIFEAWSDMENAAGDKALHDSSIGDISNSKRQIYSACA
ncbi:hypothetical protein CGMCC3_g15834 [Colletotrichum fructicola]|nr:uncharacterized protein CGMCC3_g15834 [Colletotrichum fructicola]KAE9568002.1 hypothetical protein CGMCC3_g15834 [Colletotrichum fructicola]